MKTKPTGRGRRRWSARWPQFVAAVLATLLALAPAVDAFCAIGLPFSEPTSPVASTDEAAGGHHKDPCCEHSASFTAMQDSKVDQQTSAAVRPVDRPLVVAINVLQPLFSPLPRARARTDRPPTPEPLYRRLKRLLI